jgi:hypothetical protein
MNTCAFLTLTAVTSDKETMNEPCNYQRFNSQRCAERDGGAPRFGDSGQRP